MKFLYFILGIISEILATIVIIILNLYYLISTLIYRKKDPFDPPYQVYNYDKSYPILLVHGYMMNGGAFAYIKWRLKKDGWRNIFTLTIRPFWTSPEIQGNLLKKKVETILKETNSPKIYIIGHSMGGIIGRYYIQELGGDNVVEHLITLGSPHNGTLFAYIGLIFDRKCGYKLSPNSSFIKLLKESKDKLKKVKVTSIYSNLDRAVIPYKSSNLEGANNIMIPFIGHVQLLLSPSVYKKIAQALQS